nr:SDR family oxidoreductase [Clostridioides difficile]
MYQKAAINSLTQNIATQYAKDNVRCNAVLPGLIAN